MKKIFATLAAIAAATALSFTLAACGDGKIDVTEVTLNQTELTLEVGEEKTLEATVSPQNATDKTVSWTSSDPDVASVTDGKVKAVKKGSATVTAKAGEKTATCNITVTDPTPTAMTKKEWEEAIDNTLHAENFTCALVNPKDGSFASDFYVDAKTKSISFDGSGHSHIIVTEEGDNFKYTCSNEDVKGVVPECEYRFNKPIKTFAELSYAETCVFTNLDLVKDMIKDLELTFNAEENSYFVQSYFAQLEQEASLKFFFETVDGKTRLNKFIVNPGSQYESEYIFINFGTTKTNIPQNIT